MTNLDAANRVAAELRKLGAAPHRVHRARLMIAAGCSRDRLRHVVAFRSPEGEATVEFDCTLSAETLRRLRSQGWTAETLATMKARHMKETDDG